MRLARDARGPWLTASPAMDALLDASSAVGADLPVRIERAMAAGADVANLGIAHRADDEVLLDGRAALRAGAVLGKLALAQGHVQLLLLAIGGVHAGTHDQVGDQTDKRNEGKQAPRPKCLNTATFGVDEDVSDGKQVKGDDERDENIDDHHQLRRHKLLDVLGHADIPFSRLRTAQSWSQSFGIVYPCSVSCTLRITPRNVSHVNDIANEPEHQRNVDCPNTMATPYAALSIPRPSLIPQMHLES